MKAIWLCLVLGCGGCTAAFVDWRTDAATPPDEADLGEADLPPVDLAGADLADAVLATGRFSGRAGHSGSGGAQLVQTGGGLEARMDADFSTSGVPGPLVVLTARADLGTSLAPGDLELGALQSTSGAQRYPVPGGDGGRRYLFVFCKPFGVEVSRAVLAP